MKIVKSLVAGLLLAILPCTALRAQRIYDLDIVVGLQENGTASVTETWEVLVPDDTRGTEWYVPKFPMWELSIYLEDFQVYENGQPYVNEGENWNTDRSRAEKTGHCGIVEYKDGSFDLCWGIGESGRHTWVITYTLRNLLQSFEDCDGFNFQFVNSEMAAIPSHVKITIRDDAGTAEWKPEENMGVWTFGYECYNRFEGNCMISESDGRVQYCNVMMRFDKGIFKPAKYRDISFKELKKTAFKGSDYKETEGIIGFLSRLGDLGWTILICIGLGFWAILVGIHRSWMRKTGKRYKTSVFGVKKVEGWWREAPLKGNLPAAYSLLKNGDRLASGEDYEKGLIGAYFLRWIQDGLVKIIETGTADGKHHVDLGFENPNPEFADAVEAKLYSMAYQAAGENHILEKREFEIWSRANYITINNWPSSVKMAGMPVWMGASFEDRQKLAQLKNFLQDFTMMEIRDANQVHLWKDYLVYAQLFGIAAKVAENFKKLYPVEFKEFNENMGYSGTNMLYAISVTNSYANLMTYTAREKQRQVDAERSRSSGGGGRGSYGGGGGFSGGGRGGGIR